MSISHSKWDINGGHLEGVVSMSIFDQGSGMNPFPWMQEKLLSALQAAAATIDVANEPDTTPWYRDKLRSLGDALLTRLMPVTALVFGLPQEAVAPEEWSPAVREGTLGLARWCKKWDIADPRQIGFGALATLKNEDEVEEKAAVSGKAPDVHDECAEFRSLLYSHLVRRLVDSQLSDPAHRFLAWALAGLRMSDFEDVCVLSKRFLPTDIGCSREETTAAYRELYEEGIIERVDGIPNLRADSIALRVVVQGVNESKHPGEYRDEVFGFEGARVGGQLTRGNILSVRLTKPAQKALRWIRNTDDLAELAGVLQDLLGKDKVFIEKVTIDAPPHLEELVLSAHIRVPFDANEKELEVNIAVSADKWIQERFLRSGLAKTERRESV